MGGGLSRRELLRRAGAAGAGGAAAGAAALARAAGAARLPDVELLLTAAPGEAQLYPGAPTAIWSFRGEVVRGGRWRLEQPPDAALGPTIRMRSGERIRVRLRNLLEESTIIHWHGFYIPDLMDGHPHTAIGPGEEYLYEWTVRNRAGTYWYHAHPHGRTARQIYRGLAGLFLVSDAEEEAAELPGGPYDIPVVIQDRRIDENNQLYYPGDRLTTLNGFLGDTILVNGRPENRIEVATRPYRFRILNASSSRFYKLAWEDGTPVTVIGTDGGLLARPVAREFVTLAPAERVEVWIDFRGRPHGSTVKLVSREFSLSGHHHGPLNEWLPNGAPFTILRAKVKRKAVSRSRLKRRLSTVPRFRLEDAVNAVRPRRITLTREVESWLLNGRTFEMDEVADDERVRLGDLEVWELVNEPIPEIGNMNSGAAHPIHIHGLQFQVLDRQVLPEKQEQWSVLGPGFVDRGWKDTILVMPGERVRLLMRFERYRGLYLYHCHILEHEDLGMMRNFQIE